MQKKAGSKQRKQHNDERIFFVAAVIMSVLIGASFCFLLFTLNSRGNNPEDGADHVRDDLESGPIPPDHPRQLINFTLTDRTERTVTRPDLNGKFLVVSFLFTSCSLTCPIVSSQMAQIQQLTTNQPDVQLVSLTVDPEDDTVPVLAQYGRRFDANTNRWLFLTGDEAGMEKLIGTSFLSRDTNDVFSYMPGNFANIERIALVDPSGKVRAYFDGLNQDVAGAVVAEIARLRKQILTNQQK